MKIIIIGCGKVGRALAYQLNEENHDIVIIDSQSAKLQEFNEEVDAICLSGNGASINLLKEAGVETADILIAVTGSDELNLLCCVVAKRSANVTRLPASATRFTATRSSLSRSALEFP